MSSALEMTISFFPKKMPRHEFQFYEMFCSVERTFSAVFHIDVNAAKEDLKLHNIKTPTLMRPI